MSEKNVLSGPNRSQIRERALAISEELADVEADLVAYIYAYRKRTISEDLEGEIMDSISEIKEKLIDILEVGYSL
jgi:hypothetical protein